MPQLDPSALLERLLNEGYGPGAWHGPDLKAAIADVTPELAMFRPAPGRHNIAEITLHVAYWIHVVRGRLTGTPPGPFLTEGEDWFPLSPEAGPSWEQITAELAAQQRAAVALAAGLGAGTVQAALPETEVFNQVLGLGCHAIYHAGQIQLIKKLAGR